MCIISNNNRHRTKKNEPFKKSKSKDDLKQNNLNIRKNDKLCQYSKNFHRLKILRLII